MDFWSDRISSRRHQSFHQSRSDQYLGFEEIDGGEDSKAEFPCPFCSEDFDVIGLCCHIEDEHAVEAKNGVCPVCAARVGMDIVSHITKQHGHFLKMQRRRKLRRGSAGSYSTLSLLKKELQEGQYHSFSAGSSYVTSSLNTTPDPLLSSFMCGSSPTGASKSVESHHMNEGSSSTKTFKKKAAESAGPSLSEKDQKEKAQRCEFAQQLLLSTLLEDVL